MELEDVVNEEWHNEQEKIRQLMPYKLPAKLVEYLKTGPLRLEFPEQEVEEEAEYGSRKYLEKQDFILAKQKAQLAAQQSKLDELTLKVNDMETLIDEVSAAAYDKAVEVVADVVRTETRKEDMRMIEDTKKWVLPLRSSSQDRMQIHLRDFSGYPIRSYFPHRMQDRP